jgi:S1-C subfamily serine protease
MRRFALFFFFFSFSFALFGASHLDRSVVKIQVTKKEYNYTIPWASPVTHHGWGSGFVIEGGYVVTNAHVVSDTSFVEVRLSEGTETYEAVVVGVDHECDLAILYVNDSNFLSSTVPLQIADEMAPIQEKIIVVGFPIGGRKLCVTQGIISRIDMDSYVHSSRIFPIAQVDAAVNWGNSGGPVIADEKVVGVIHQGCEIGQNLNYMIPVPIIRHFLKEIKESKYEGFPTLGIVCQPIKNPALRAFYQMRNGDTGILVTDVSETSFLTGQIQRGDIILSVGGYRVSNEGTVTLNKHLEVPFLWFTCTRYYGDSIPIRVLRDGKSIDFSIYLDKNRKGENLVSCCCYDKPPTYFILGGLVFQPLNDNLIESLASVYDYLGVDFLYYSLYGKVKEGRSELVVITQILQDHVNMGYNIFCEIVSEVNGKKIHNMRDLIETLENSTDPYYRIFTEDDTEIILDLNEVRKRNQKILSIYSIPCDRSVDLEESMCR